MHEIADLKTLPQNKFRDITPPKDNTKEYEIKTKHLRVYRFHEKIQDVLLFAEERKEPSRQKLNTSEILRRNI